MADERFQRLVDDTYAEAFRSIYAEVLITARDRTWLDHAVNAATGNASSTIFCDCEAGLDRYVGPGGDESFATPDGRPGVRYDYRFERAGGRAVLSLDSDAPVPGTLALRLPAGWRPVSLERDGQPLAFEERRVGEDLYAVAATGWGRRRFELVAARAPR